MAVEIEVRSDSKQARADLDRLNRAVENISSTTDKVSKQFDNLVKVSAAAFAVIGSAKAITNVTDSYRRLEARIALTTDSIKEQGLAFKQLNSIAIRTRSNQESLADLYSRIGRATKKLGVEQSTVIQVTENIAKAITISGSSAESANAAIVQLGQGLAAGALRGQELNSVLEQTPGVAQAIARGLGKDVGQLRAFANEGKLSAEVVIEALKGQSKAIDEEFRKISPTFAQAFTVFGTGVGRIVNEIDQLTGFSNKIVVTLLNLGTSLNDAAVPLREFLSGLNEGGIFGDALRGTLTSVGLVVRSLGNLFVEAFNRLIPLSFLLTIQRLRGAFVSFFLQGTSDVIRVLNIVDVALFDLSKRIDVFTASIARSPVAKIFRGISVSIASAAADARIATTVLIEGFLILESIVVTKIAKIGITAQRFIGVFTNTLIRTTEELKNFDDAVNATFKNFTASISLAVDSLERLKALGELTRVLADVVIETTRSGESITKFTKALKGLSDEIEGSFDASIRNLRGQINTTFTGIVKDVKQKSKEIGKAIADTLSGKSGSKSSFGEEFTNSLFRSLGVNRDISKDFRKLVQGVRDFSNIMVDNLTKAYRGIKAFANSVIETFENIYMEVIGNSSWTDTMKGIPELAEEGFRKTVRKLKEFKDNVAGTFLDLEVLGVSLGRAIGGIISFGIVQSLIGALGLVSPILAGIVSLASLATIGIFIFGGTIEGVEAKMAALSEKTADFFQNFNLLTSGTQILLALREGLEAIGAFDSIIDTARLIRAVIQPIGAALNSIFADAIGAGIVLAIVGAKAGIIGVGFAIASVLGLSITQTLDSVLQSFGTDVGEITENVFSKLGTVVGDVLIAALKELPAFLFNAGAAFVDGLLSSLPIIGGALATVFSTVNGLLLGIPAIAAGGVIFRLLFGPKGSLGISNIIAQVAGTVGLVKNIVRALAGQAIAGEVGAIGLALFGRDGAGGVIKVLTGLLPQIGSYFSAVYAVLANAFSSANVLAIFEPLKTAILTTFSGLFAQMKIIATTFTSGRPITDLFTNSTIGSPAKLKATLASFFAGLRGADNVAAAVEAKARRRAGTGGIFGKVLLGVGGLAAFFASTGAVASEVDSLGGGFVNSLLPFAEIGLIGASLFGVAGISAAVSFVTRGMFAVVAPVLTGLTTILFHPVFLTIAAIVAGVAALGALGVALFGVGNTFFEKLDNVNLRLQNQFGLIDTFVSGYSRKSALEQALVGDFDPQSIQGISSVDIRARNPKDVLEDSNISLTSLSGDQFSELLTNSLELKRAIFALNELQEKSYSTQKEQIRAETDLVVATLKTNTLIEQLRQDSVALGRELIEKGITPETAPSLSQTDTTILASIQKPLAIFGDLVGNLVGLDFGLRESVIAPNEESQLEEGRLGPEQLARVQRDLKALNQLQEQFGQNVGENIAQIIGEADGEFRNVQDFNFLFGLFNDSDVQKETEAIAAKLEKAINDALDNVQLFGGASKIADVAKQLGVELNRTSLLFATPAQRADTLALVDRYELAVRNFESSTTENIAANQAAVEALALALKTSVGSRQTATNTLLEGAGVGNLEDGEFSRFNSEGFAEVVSGYASIAKLENDLLKLNGQNFDEEVRIRKEIEAQRLALRQLTNDTSTFVDVLSGLNLSEFQEINLNQTDFSNVLTAQQKILDLRLEQESLANTDIFNYQRIERLLREQEELIQSILNGTRSVSEILASTNIGDLGATRIDAKQLAGIESATLRITELRQEQITLGNENLSQYQENIKLIREQEEIIQRILDGTASLGDLLGNFSGFSNILDNTDLSTIVSDNIQITRLRREQQDLNESEVERFREIDEEISRIVNGQNRLNDSIGRGVKFAQDLRSTFQETVEGIFTGANDIGDIFDNVLKQIASSAIEGTAQSITDIVFGKDNTQLENYFGKLFKSADEEGTGWLTRIAKGAQDIITPVFDGIFGEGSLGKFGSFINDTFGGIFGGSEEAPDGSSSSPFAVRLVEGVEGIAGNIGDQIDDILPKVDEDVGEGGKVLDTIREKLGLNQEGEGFFTKIFTGFKDLVSNAGSIFSSGFSSIVGGVGSLLTTGFQGIVSNIGGLFSSIGGLFSGGGSGGGIFSSLISGVTGFFSGGFSGIFESISGLFTGKGGEGGGLFSGLLGLFGGGGGAGGALNFAGGGGILGNLLGGLDKRGQEADGTKNNPYYVIPVQEESILSNLLGGGPLAGLVEGLGGGPGDALSGGLFSALTSPGTGGGMGECPCGESNQMLQKSIGGLAPELDGVFQNGVDGFGGILSQLPQLLGGLFGGGGGGNFLSTAISLLGFFNDGGIVPGGGPVPVMAHGGEMILNKRQQSNLFGQMDKNSGSNGQQQVINVNVTGDISRQTKKEVYGMLPQLATGINQYNSEKGNSK